MRVAVLRPAHRDAEADAACRWIEGREWELVVVGPDVSSLPDGTNVVWCHAGSRVPALDPDGEAFLADYVRRGGTVVLSLLAATSGTRLGGAGPPPSLVDVERPWRNEDDPQWTAAFRQWPGYPHIRGFQGWGAHPLFRAMQTGTFSWTATEGEAVSRAVYVRPDWPDARVVAVDRSYVHLDADTAVAWEYDVGRGRITCLGANVSLCATNGSLAAQRDLILLNALTQPSGIPRTGWPPAEKRHAAVAPFPRMRSIGATGEEPSVEAITQAPAAANPVTLGAPGGLVVGSMTEGVKEVWLHPLCVIGDGITVTGPSSLAATSATASAVHLARALRDSSGSTWREAAFVHATAPEFVYVLSSGDPVPTTPPPDHPTIEFRMPLRRQWPFPANALVPLRTELRRDGARAVVMITGRDGAHVAACFIDGAADVTVNEDEAMPTVRVVAAPGDTLRLVVRASSSGSLDLAPVTTDAWSALQERVDGLRRQRERTTRLVSGDAALDDAWGWACARLANFVAAAPTGGRGLMAGYASSRAGWNVSRPGYAWFFGRDACWTIDALLAVGLFEEARDAITLLAETMDVTGKVIHELTTSGVAHYDAADSTPLFLRAVGLYAEWTGDRDTLVAWWSKVERAFDFVMSCDHDDDGLPENTGVGHGWIEMGPLGGGAVTSYVAAIWIDALRRLALVARDLDQGATAKRMADALARAEAAIEGLRGPDGVLALHRDTEGRLNTDRTAMGAVPIALGVGASSSDRELLDDLASPRFSAPWGLRMLPVDDPRYDPVAYHAGSAWPLFTGWAALADCATGAVDRGFARVRSLAGAAMAGGTGGFAEVLNGDTGERAGVCPDQAWSAAMILSPIVRGVAGVVPDASHGRCAIRSRALVSQRTLRLEGVRVGETRFDVQWTRASDDACAIAATHREGPAIELHLDDFRGRSGHCAAGTTLQWTAFPDRTP